jgi:hypothetical protein
MFAPPICRRRWGKMLFGFDSSDEDGRQPSEHRRERSEQSNKSAMREQDRKKAAI